jgi:hypothetical protein
MAEAKRTSAAEAAALQAVYVRLADLLSALRQAQGQIRDPGLLAVINAEIDRQLEADAALRKAIVEHTGQPVQDPY